MTWFHRLLCITSLLLAACGSVAIDDAERFSRNGDLEAAYATLDNALRAQPGDAALRTAHSRARDRIVVRALATAELALAGGRTEEAQRLLDRVRRLDAQHPRLAGIEANIENAQREQRQVDARRAQARAAPSAPPPALGPAFQKPVTLEFRDAPLRQVFESLARSSSINFVFDKDVRADARITVFLRGVTLDEGMRVILATQQLDRKLLNDSTVLVYPNTPAKQREHQELVTRSLYLTNADVKQVLPLVRTMAKTRDLHADERLNALVIRDTPEIVRLVEKLIATIDLPDPEVMLAVEVLEVASDQLEELGLSWPDEVRFGIPNASGQISLSGRGDFRGSVANPALTATLRSTAGTTNLLANPTIRARNHEKARVQIGEKLPVFTTTTAANVGTSASVSYLDVGLKLDVEPSVQLDGEVIIKVALEVSNLLREVNGPAGSLAYQVGTRLTTTSLRLRDGQTQVLAGLINDEDRRSATGIPGLTQLPLIGRLFGLHGNSRNKTEIVMLITPRIVRNLALPDPADASLASGTEALPGAEVLRLRPRAGAGVAAAGPGSPRTAAAAEPRNEDAPQRGALLLSASAEAAVGDTASVTLANPTSFVVKGEVEVDPTLLQAASGGAAATNGRVPFTLEPRQDAVLVFRVLPAAAGNEVRATIGSVSAATASGDAAEITVEGSGAIRIRPASGK
jgi:general secretion pathway protein D